MSPLENFLRELRHHSAIQALVPVDASMVVPLKAGEGLLYIPFVRYLGKNRCRLVCDLFAGYPSGEIYSYQKIMDGRELHFDEDELFVMKRELLAGEEGLKTRQNLSQGLSGLYQRVSERREYDKYTGGA